MTEKRFTVHIKWFNCDKTEGEITLKDNGQLLLESECIEDVQRLKVILNELNEENEQLKKVLGAILLEVKQDISNTNQSGEIKVFINPNSFDLISEVLRKYGALKDWY